MSELTLNIHNEGDITLPGELANSTLTLSEIGAVVVFAAMQQGIMPELRNSPEATAEMQSATAALKEKGVLKIGIVNQTLKIELDLEGVMPASDDDDNG